MCWLKGLEVLKTILEILVIALALTWIIIGWIFFAVFLDDHSERGARYITKGPTKDCKRGATECVGKVK